METSETKIEKEVKPQTARIKKETVYLCPKIVEIFQKYKENDPNFSGGDKSDFIFFDTPDNQKLREELSLIKGIEFIDES